MRCKVSKLVLAVIGIATCNTAMAYDFVSNGIYYTLRTSDMSLIVDKGDEPYKGEIVIPNEVEYNTRTLQVKEIADEAFFECQELTAISLPTSITTIGKNAFFRCTGLTSLTLPTGLTTIKEYAFQFCTGIKELFLPKNVMQVDRYAFSDWHSVTEIIIEDSDDALTMGSAIFGKFESFCAKTVYVGRTLSKTGTDWEFFPFGCNSALETVTIGEKVRSLKDNFFQESNVLKTVINMSGSPFECSDNVFSNDTYINGKLIVPNGTSAIYKQTKCWSNFFVIEEDEDMNTGIRQIETSNGYDIYSISGTKTGTPNKGVNIIKSKDGRSKKVFVR